jgi:metal-responsive CopG/Arc/MetJ family transcriptional regulator
MNVPKIERLAVQVTRAQLDALDRCATAFWTSRSELVRQALMKDLSSRGFAPLPPEEA